MNRQDSTDDISDVNLASDVEYSISSSVTETESNDEISEGTRLD